MNNEMRMRKRQMLESLEYLDDDLISGVLIKIKPERELAEPVKTWRTPFKHWKQLVALAASLILLSVASPLANFISQAVSNFRAGAGSGTTESSEILNTELTDLVEADPPSISQEELDAINTAWENYQGGIYAKTADKIQYLQGSNRFYGKYNGCIVLARQTPLDFYEEQNVNGLIFKCPGIILWVCINAEYYSLERAYTEGHLSDAQINEIWNLHYTNNLE